MQLQITPSHHKCLPHPGQTVKQAFVSRILLYGCLDCLEMGEWPLAEAFDHLGFCVLVDADLEN